MIKISGQGNEAWVIHTSDADGTCGTRCRSANSTAATTLLLPPKHQNADLVSSRQPLNDINAERHDYERKRRDLEEQSKRERELIRQRQVEVEDREVEVSRRERWVVEEMRKLVDKTQWVASVKH